MDLTCRVQAQATGFTGIRASAIGSIPVTTAAKGLPSAKTWDDLIFKILPLISLKKEGCFEHLNTLWSRRSAF
jgi:hypothetical protein